MWKVLSLVLPVTVGVVVYWLYTPLPEGYEQPVRTQAILAIYKLDRAWSTAVTAVFNVAGWEGADRYTYAFLSFVKAKCTKYDTVKVSKTTLDGIEATLYDHVDRGDNSKAVVFYHGGGWVWEDEDYYSCYYQEIAQRTTALIVSVRYRIAPEHVFPAGLNDCLQATKHFITNAATFGVDASKVAIAGDSAGGQFAAVIAQVLRDEGFHTPPAAQILIIPALQAYDFLTSSYQLYGESSLTKNQIVDHWLVYFLGEVTEQDMSDLSNDKHKPSDIREAVVYNRVCDVHLIPDDYYLGKTERPVIGKNIEKLKPLYSDSRLSPSLAHDVSGLPRALVITAEVDVLRDDGLMYVSRLQEARNGVVHTHYYSAFHGFEGYFNTGMDAADHAMNDVVKFIGEI